MSQDAHPQPFTLLTPAAPGAELAACEGDSCFVPGLAAPSSISTTQE